MKVVTTWGALEYLGPAYTWPTEIYFLGDFDGQTLDGDLAIKGYGDPYLVVEEVWKLLRALRRTGLTDITGDLVLDASHFVVDEPDPGAFDGQPYRTYNVVPNALLMNFKAVQFQFRPDPVRGRVNVATDPVLANLDDRQQPHADRRRRAAATRPASPSITRTRRRSSAWCSTAAFSRRCNVYGLSRTVLQHDTFAFGLFSSLWKEVGGSFSGQAAQRADPGRGDAGVHLAVEAARRGRPQHQQEQQQRDDAAVAVHARRGSDRRARARARTASRPIRESLDRRAGSTRAR